MVIFRENTEDIYAGLEVEEGTPEAKKLIGMLKDAFGWDIKPDSGIGIKPVSESGSKRLIRAAIQYAVKRKRKSVTLVHKGNIMKFTEGAFRNWGYELTRRVLRRRRRLGRLRRQARRQDPREGRDRRHHAPAGAHAARRVRRDRHAQPQRRLPLRRARRAGRRHRHRTRRQHQLRHRSRRVRGDARHRPEVRGPGQGEPGLGDPVGRDDVRAPRMAGRGRRHRPGARGDHRRQDRHLRLRPAHGRRDRGEDLRVRAARSSTGSDETRARPERHRCCSPS